MIKPKLIAGMSVYNEEENIHNCLESMKEIIDGVCLVDGKYFGYPSKHFYSTDNTINIAAGWCESNGKEFNLIYYGGYRQKNKRTQYLQNPCKNPDENTWILINDPDMNFEDLGNFRQDFEKYATMKNPDNTFKYNFLAIMCSEQQQFENRPPYPKDLLLRYEPGLKYQPNHWIVSNKNNVLYCATNQSKTHVLPGKVTNKPLDRKDWKRKHDRSIYRAIRLLSAPSRWGDNFYETGNDKQEKYIDNDSDIETFRRNLQHRIDTAPTDVDLGIVNIVNWIKHGSLATPEVLNEFNRGQLIGMLIMCGLVPNPYIGDKEADL